MGSQYPINNHDDSIRVGISACLLGQSVRFNGGHSKSQTCTNLLSKYFFFEPFCPEVAAGFGTPRPTMRLVGDPKNPRLTFSDDTPTDLSEQLIAGFKDKVNSLDHLDGYIVMKNSPSCGMERIKVYQENGYPSEEKTKGLFTKALQEKYPLLPVEEEGRLNDPALRENFILRVFTFHNFRIDVMANPTYHRVLQFHSKYKFILLAHSQPVYRRLGRLLANARNQDIAQLAEEYLTEFMTALKKPANRKNHTNVMLHLVGFLKQEVPGIARQKMVETIQKYHDGQIPLITPLTLLKHYSDQFGTEYLQSQRYLNPYPEELGLQNRL